MDLQLSVFCKRSLPVKSLPGFRPTHRVPQQADAMADQFVAEVGAETISQELDRAFSALRTAYGLSRKQLQVTEAQGCGSVATQALRFDVELRANPESPADALWCRSIHSLSDLNELRSSRLGRVFAADQWKIRIEVETGLDLEGLVDQLEQQPIQLDYDRQLSYCRIQHADCAGALRFDARGWEFAVGASTTIADLMKRYVEINAAIELEIEPLMQFK